MTHRPFWPGLYRYALIVLIFTGIVVAGHQAAPQLAGAFQAVASMSLVAGR